MNCQLDVMADVNRLLPSPKPTSLISTPYISEETLNLLNEWMESLTVADKMEACLRALRNKLIGHVALKRVMVLEKGLIGKLTQLLKPGIAIVNQQLAVTILGSVPYGGREELEVLLQNQVPQLLLSILVEAISERQMDYKKLLESTMSSLRNIYRHSGFQRDLPFNEAYLNVIMEQFKGEIMVDLKIKEYAAVMLANCCDSKVKQEILIKKGIVETAVKMISLKALPISSIEAWLDLLAAITRENSIGCKVIVEKSVVVNQLFEFLSRKLHAEIKILSSIVLANLNHFGLLQRNGPNREDGEKLDVRIKKILLPSLIGLISNVSSSSVKAKAAEVIAMFLRDSEELQLTSIDSELVARLAAMLQNDRLEEEKEASLLAFAALTSSKEECRRKVIDARILSQIVQAMESENEGVRSAACQCTRSLSRSVKNLRTTLVDAGMIKPLMKLLYDESLLVQKMACSALCNLVLDFSPLKETVLKEGGVKRMVQMLKMNDPDLRFNSLWALKNLLYLADTKIKHATMKEITYELLEALLMDASIPVQTQAMNLVRNLICEKEQDIEEVLSKFGEEKLIRLVELKLESKDDEIVIHSCYVIANACTATSAKPKDLVISNNKILNRIKSLISPGIKSDVQMASLWCIINLTWTEDEGSMERIRILRNYGFEKQLLTLAGSGLAPDVKDRVQTALDNFAASDPSQRA